MCYHDLLMRFTEMSKEIFGNNLTGIYLHGSASMGYFNPEKSDLDLLLVIEADISDEQKLVFMKNVVSMNAEAPAKGIEMSVIKREFCKPFVYPTPYELHFSVMHLNWFKENPKDYVQKMKGTDKDLAAHITVIHHSAVVLYGAKVGDVFGEVPRCDYIDSIYNDIKEAKTEILRDPMYIILTLCRVLGYLKDNRILSKQTGGEWGIEKLPQEYHGLIQEALSCYQTDRIMEADIETVKAYADYILTEIEKERKRINESDSDKAQCYHLLSD